MVTIREVDAGLGSWVCRASFASLYMCLGRTAGGPTTVGDDVVIRELTDLHAIGVQGQLLQILILWPYLLATRRPRYIVRAESAILPETIVYSGTVKRGLI